MLTQVQKEAIYRRLSVNSEAIDHLLVRANAHAEDITELTRRLKKLELGDELDALLLSFKGLEKRIEQLERLLEREE